MTLATTTTTTARLTGLARTTTLSLTVAAALGLGVCPSAEAREPDPGEAAPAPDATPVPSVPLAPPSEALLTPVAGGLTGDGVARRAVETSFSVKQGEESLKAAAARVDQSWQAFLPRLRAGASAYWVDISNPPSLGTVVVDKAGPGPIGASQLAAGNLRAIPLTLPSTLGSYLLQASITVPLSDYFLRIDETYGAAKESREAARYDLASARATSAANARVAFYTWLRARGAVVVANQALGDQRTHLALARSLFAAGRASRVDVLRAETDAASAELSLEQAKNLAALGEKQVRVAIHARDDEQLLPGEGLDATPPPVPGQLRALEDEAVHRRAEVKSLLANASSLRQQAKATRNAGYPSLSASGNAIAANTDAGSLGPTSNWTGVWYLSAQLSWSPNETGTQASAGAEASHKAAALDAQVDQLKDGIEIEVTQDFQNVHQADVSIATAERELASAEEGYRVARQLYDNGRATSSDLTDSETDLTRARLDLLNARVNARVSRVQLEHALGRDLGPI
jgi:outer membrane protein TolC